MQSKVIVGIVFIVAALAAVVTDGFTETIGRKPAVVTTPAVVKPTPVVTPVTVGTLKPSVTVTIPAESSAVVTIPSEKSSAVHITDPDTLVNQNQVSQVCASGSCSSGYSSSYSGARQGPVRRFFRRGR